MTRNTVFFVGPLPPPLGGFSAINQKMLGRLSDRADVRVFDTAPKSLSAGPKWTRFFTVFHRLRSMCMFLFFALARRPDSLYVGLSGGLGQLYDSFYILIARLVRLDVFVHHHSFAYLNEVKLHNRVCLGLAEHACHIVLCDVMAEKLTSGYLIPKERIFILSNVAFLDERKNTPEVGNHDLLTLGFISNITLEKGIVEFFEVIANLAGRGQPIRGLVAGPVDPALQGRFFSLLRTHPAIEYLGPVYGERKEMFFQSVDMLLFPTKYKNEAEPVSILEALSYGIPVLSADRGCIHSMIDEMSGALFPFENYVAAATEYIMSVLAGTISLHSLSEGASNQFNTLRACYGDLVADLVSKIAGQKL